MNYPLTGAQARNLAVRLQAYARSHELTDAVPMPNRPYR